MTIEAMKQAIEALNYIEGNYMSLPKVGIEAITSLRQAIEQAEKREPVSWVDLLKEASQIVRDKVVWKRFIDGTPLANDIACWMADFAIQHAQQPQREWVGLTDEDLSVCDEDGVILARYWEAKLKEKNT